MTAPISDLCRVSDHKNYTAAYYVVAAVIRVIHIYNIILLCCSIKKRRCEIIICAVSQAQQSKSQETRRQLSPIRECPKFNTNIKRVSLLLRWCYYIMLLLFCHEGRLKKNIRKYKKSRCQKNKYAFGFENTALPRGLCAGPVSPDNNPYDIII